VFFCLFLFVDLWFVVLLGCGAVRAVHNLILLAKTKVKHNKPNLTFLGKKRLTSFGKKVEEIA
jgi:hypothetical protein